MADHKLGSRPQFLSAIYHSPVSLLAKVIRDGDALILALRDCNESAVHDSLFNFSVSAFHLVDWVKKLRPDLEQKVNDLLNGSEPLRACRDLANASKHVILKLDEGPYKQYPPVLQDAVKRSAPAATSTPNTPALPPQPWRLKVQMQDRTIRVEEIVEEVIDQWQRFTDNAIA
ncbi:hypothetical protein [Paraburkholderia kirstenboschensis]|uniref:hypothetical protein n=1 Tax=Paraburkholderia kirstenboschensis TaxID=1245436 RepID=UPI000AD1CA2F|nr:hypothetical protein [Paraburkholderia kirstenboschensis]